jgi:hypothetical protein
LSVPVRSLEVVDEVDAERVLGPADLPILISAGLLELLIEPPDLVGDDSLKAGRVRNRRTQRTQYGAAFSLTS